MGEGFQAPDQDGGVPSDAWFKAALDESSDTVIVIRRDTTIVWCNQAVRQVGYEPATLVGRSLTDLLHPDDLVRAGEVMLLEAAGVFKQRTPMTPALYRVRRADGTWHTFEVNASTAVGDDHLLVVARTGGDLVIYLQLLEAVTGGKPFEEQVASVVELARWRHPSEGYAICYHDDDGQKRWQTAGVPRELVELEPAADNHGWSVAVGADPEVATLAPQVRAAADEAGFLECLVCRVEDPAHPDGALLTIWTTECGPTVSGHTYAMANMRRALALVLQQRSQLRALERAARTDPLTGLASRGRLLELLEAADSAAGSGAPPCHVVLYVDLDGFKGVNDSLGHTRGDLVLEAAARRLAAAVPDDAVLARIGGDEFVVLCAPGTSEDQAGDLAARIVAAFDPPLDLADGGLRASVGASVGVAVGSPGQPVTAVLDAADQALYRAKEQGRGRWAMAERDRTPGQG